MDDITSPHFALDLDLQWIFPVKHGSTFATHSEIIADQPSDVTPGKISTFLLCFALFSGHGGSFNVTFEEFSETTGNLGTKHLEVRHSLARKKKMQSSFKLFGFSTSPFHCCSGVACRTRHFAFEVCFRGSKLCGHKPSFNFDLLSSPSFGSGYNGDGKLVVVSVDGFIALVKLGVSVLNVVALAFGSHAGSVAPIALAFTLIGHTLLALESSSEHSPSRSFPPQFVTEFPLRVDFLIFLLKQPEVSLRVWRGNVTSFWTEPELHPVVLEGEHQESRACIQWWRTREAVSLALTLQWLVWFACAPGIWGPQK